MYKKLPSRKPNRLQGYDYSRNGAYFVTICAKDRAEIFAEIPAVGATALGRPYSHPPHSPNDPPPTHPLVPTHNYPSIRLTEIGKCIDETIHVANNGDVHIDCYVIMPNHIHMIVAIRSSTYDGWHSVAGDRGRSPLQFIVRNIKSYVTKQIGFSPWQKSFHDHIIRNENEYIRIVEYIKNNPARWIEDCFYRR